MSQERVAIDRLPGIISEACDMNALLRKLV